MLVILNNEKMLYSLENPQKYVMGFVRGIILLNSAPLLSRDKMMP